MTKLLDYLNLIDTDANALADFQKDPVKAMTDFGLTQSEREAVLSGDKQSVADLLGVSVDSIPKIQSTDTTY